jgi:7-keto-8-aminopelargonate synthetase-like enzyme
MAKDPDQRSRFDAALARLQAKHEIFGSARQKPIVQRTTEALYARFSPSTHEPALDDAANALASLWKIRR